MTYYIKIPVGDRVYCYKLLPFGDIQRIECHGVVILDIYKHHNNRYDLLGFFYDQKVIVGPFMYRSKKELNVDI